MSKLVSVMCAASLFAAMAACSSRTPDWSQPAFIAAQPTVGQPTTDPSQPTPVGCPCAPSVDVDVTVTDPAGNPVTDVTFPGNMGVCVGWGNSSATPDAGARDAPDAASQDGSADGDALDTGEAEGEAALDARFADAAVDSGDPNDAAAPDAADAAEAAEAGEGACTTWRFWISPPGSGVEVTAPGYYSGTAEVTWSSPCCEGFGTVPVVDRSVVLQPLPTCPADWGPCSRDAGLRGSPASCICP